MIHSHKMTRQVAPMNMCKTSVFNLQTMTTEH